ncbi:hypothetical protein GB994_00500 [Weissella cibaria]|nr:hypothetical protein [Weissella cibaria]
MPMTYQIPTPNAVRDALEQRRRQHETSPLCKMALHLTNTYLTELAIELAVKKMMVRAENVQVDHLLSEVVSELKMPHYFSQEYVDQIRETIRADAAVENAREVLNQIDDLIQADMRSWFAYKRQVQVAFEDAGYAVEGTTTMIIVHPELMIEKFTLI